MAPSIDCREIDERDSDKRQKEAKRGKDNRYAAIWKQPREFFCTAAGHFLYICPSLSFAHCVLPFNWRQRAEDRVSPTSPWPLINDGGPIFRAGAHLVSISNWSCLHTTSSSSSSSSSFTSSFDSSVTFSTFSTFSSLYRL